MYFVYLALTARGCFYAGIALDPTKRIATHNSGKGAKCLRGQLPVSLAWVSSSPVSKSKALREEARIKTLSHVAKAKMTNGVGTTFVISMD